MSKIKKAIAPICIAVVLGNCDCILRLWLTIKREQMAKPVQLSKPKSTSTYKLSPDFL